MAKEYALSFYRSKAWNDCRDGYITSVKGLCERCIMNSLYVPGKIVHHKIPLSIKNINDPYISLSWDNLEYLCQDCHNKEHHSEEATGEGLMFNGNGELIKV